MFLEIILASLWQILLLGFLILAGLLWKDRRSHRLFHASSASEDLLLPDRLKSFRQRQPYANFKRASRLRRIQ